MKQKRGIFLRYSRVAERPLKLKSCCSFRPHRSCKIKKKKKKKPCAGCFASLAFTFALTSSKNCCVRRRMCLSSVSSRKFFFSASWLVLISFSSFSSFSNVA